MPPPPLSRSPFGSRLPFEVLEIILSHVKDPLDLYHFSLVNQEWRQASFDSSSWEDAFWRFYRPRVWEDQDQRSLLIARVIRRARAMQDWLQQTANSPPTACVARPCDNDKELAREVGRGQDIEAVPPYEPLVPSAPSTAVPLPPFLEAMLAIRSTERLSFHSLFQSRMNADQRLLVELEEHVQKTCGIFEDMKRLVEQYGDDAREVLAALCATQAVSNETVQDLLTASDLTTSTRLRALTVHGLASQGLPQPHVDICLTLRFAAEQILTHLQKREAILSLRGLQERCQARGEGEQCSSEELVFRSSAGIQESLEDMGLFCGADKAQLREYLDLLALLVWAELQAQDRQTPSSDTKAYGPPPHWQLLPRDSSRHLAARVVGILRTLGFGKAGQSNSADIANHFVHVSILCPAQRQTADTTLANIVCSVLRRLGVLATPLATAFRVCSMALEGAPEPEDWVRSPTRHWHIWYLDANDVESRSVIEFDEVARYLLSWGVNPPYSQMFPLPPRITAIQAAERLHSACLNLAMIDRAQREACAGGLRGKDDTGSSNSAARDPLTALRLYLEGHQAAPPEVLPPATLLSHLAGLPATTLGAPRATTEYEYQAAQISAVWIKAALAQGPDELRQAEEVLCSFLKSSFDRGMNVLDVLLLGELFQSPSAALRRLEDDVFAADEVEGVGIGGHGGGEAKDGRASWTEEEQKQRLDRKATKYIEVMHRVGTVFEHRNDGYTAVIVGWDCERCAEKDLPSTAMSDPKPHGPSQPHYYALDEDGHLRYVPQAAVNPVKIGTAPLSPKRTQGLVKLLALGRVGRCFRTLRVLQEEREQGGASKEGAGSVMLAMNAWLREAWPFD